MAELKNIRNFSIVAHIDHDLPRSLLSLLLRSLLLRHDYVPIQLLLLFAFFVSAVAIIVIIRNGKHVLLPVVCLCTLEQFWIVC